ncbi:CDP-alcohol phosphatidyltransferase family protein [Tunicatimonas pelagia]|uniref:CDP-alcohol phosphatidyltransferase family protein n=1 Tax=Tunicatimonas pelagia TaxID=931531 RepID=UPI0026653A63|nr:CDP-alcohol phosphatidyltransferase family protein [Tunicatimonas pelagia]WKN44600.1 CDP-alcohol phosphatidyltransferase family protein [Tunicatimonas pelagia]
MSQPTIAPRLLDVSVKFLSLAMMFAAFLFVLTNSLHWFLGVAVISAISWVLWHREQWQIFGLMGGVANVLTGMRWLGIAVLVGFCQQLHPYVVLVLGILVLVLDGLDGYYARKYQTASEFGDVFDKEADAFFVLAFGVIIVALNLASSWVLLPGLLRYGYVIILAYVDKPPAPVGYSFRRRLVGMWMMGTLLAPFVFPAWAYVPCLVAAIVMILYSFAVDLRGSWIRTSIQ